MRLIATALLCVPSMAFAVGSDTTTTPPAAPACTDGKVRDAQTGRCVAPSDARLDDAERYEAVREYAYADQVPEAVAVLDAMQDQGADGVLTYRGFTARKMGDMESAMDWYRQALSANPDNLLARSYMGMGFVEAGAYDLARAELSEIRARGGRNTWPEMALRLALTSGRGTSY